MKSCVSKHRFNFLQICVPRIDTVLKCCKNFPCVFKLKSLSAFLLLKSILTHYLPKKFSLLKNVFVVTAICVVT